MAPYRLAVCEDDPAERRQLQALCGRLLSRREIPHTLTAFASAGALAEELERDPAAFDLLLLDIQMEGMTGMELAHILHDRHMPVRVLFVTGCPDYALEGHQVHPVHYLLKPVEPAALDEVLYQDWEAHCGARSVMFRQGSRAVLLPLEEISRRFGGLTAKPRIDPIFVLLTVGLANASFCRLFGGDWTAVGIVFTATLVGFAAKQRMQAHGVNHYLVFIVAAFMASLCASAALRFDCTAEIALATSPLFLVPGVPLINGVIDIVEGHILIGFSRLINALLLIICIAVGLAATLLMVKDSLL